MHCHVIVTRVNMAVVDKEWVAVHVHPVGVVGWAVSAVNRDFAVAGRRIEYFHIVNLRVVTGCRKVSESVNHHEMAARVEVCLLTSFTHASGERDWESCGTSGPG